jgi:acyl-CoA reductase-like NAD-dependent aldehyde dehydrogenase
MAGGWSLAVLSQREAFDPGFFFKPTLIDGANDSALVMTEESYGPIAAVRGSRGRSACDLECPAIWPRRLRL